jgi:hypothetical protein
MVMNLKALILAAIKTVVMKPHLVAVEGGLSNHT